MKKIVCKAVAGLALGASLFGSLQVSQAADSAVASMFQSLPINIPGVDATVYLNPSAGGLDVSGVTGGTVYDSTATLDCASGADPTDTRNNATNFVNGDIVLQCGFLVTGISTTGKLIP